MTSDKSAAGILVGTSMASMGLMSIHPTGDASEMLISGVHGSLMLVLLAQAAALLWLLPASTLRGLNALIFYVAGVIATMGAGTLNGFLFPALRAYDDGEIGHDIFDLVWWANQVFAELGVLGIGIAIGLWSVGLVRSGEKAIGVFGLLAGIAPAFLLLSGHIGMDLHGALLAYAIHVLWIAAFGLSRWRRA